MNQYTPIGESDPPLDAWCEPCAGEPVHGFFQRLTKLNHQTSTSFLAAAVGVNGRNFDPHELLEFCRQFPLSNFDKLIDASPVFLPNKKVSLNGEIFRRGIDWSIEQPRVCGACLAEAGFYRNWFDLIVVHSCPYHGLPLWSGSGSSALKWWYSELGVAPDGTSLVQSSPRPRLETARSWDSYVVGRLSENRTVEIAALDNAQMFEVVETVELLGRMVHMSFGGSFRRPPRIGAERARVLEEGFAIVRAGEAALDEVFLKLMSHPSVERHKLTFGVDQCFGFMNSALRALSDSSAAGIVRSAIERVSTRANIYSRKRYGRLVKPEGAPLTLRELGRRLNMRPAKVREVAIALGLTTRKACRSDYHSFPPEAVRRISEVLADLVTRDGTAAMLGLTSKDVNSLIRAGVLRAFRKRRSSAHVQLRRSEIETLLAAARYGLGDAPSNAGVCLEKYCEMTGTARSTAIVLIRKGKLAALGWDGSKKGFLAYIVEKPEKRLRKAGGFHHRKTPALAGYSFFEVQEILGVSSGCVCALIKLGYLKLVRTHARRRRIDRDSLAEFQGNFIPAKCFAGLLGCSKSVAYRELEKFSVYRLSEPELRKYSFVRRGEARMIFGENSDPDRFSRLGADGFWLGLRSFLQTSGSHCKVSTQPGSLCGRITTSDRVVSAIITLHPEDHSLTFEVHASAIAERRRFKLLSSCLPTIQDFLPEVSVLSDSMSMTLTIQRDDICLDDQNCPPIFDWIGEHMLALRSLVRTAGKSQSLSPVPMGSPRAAAPAGHPITKSLQRAN